MLESRRCISGFLIIILILTSLSSYTFDVFAQDEYPPPPTSEPSSPQNSLLFTPLIVYKIPPPATLSYYVLDITSLFNVGYELGIQDQERPGIQDNLVIIDYGYPAKQGSDFGVFLTFDQTGTFHPMTEVITSAIEFAQGYFVGTGDDYYSHLRMVIGFNNCCNENTLVFFQDHGTAFGQAVNSISSGISSYSLQVDAVGGGDIEMDYNDPFTTAQWLNAYMVASNCNPGSSNTVEGCFYDFGNLAVSISGPSCATSETSPWVACDVWYVSWGAQKNSKRYARPLPEIYHDSETRPPWGTDATAWKDLSLFSANQMSAGKMYFVGTLTQRSRCGDSCGQGNNYPWEGYLLLFNALLSNTTTKMSMRWSTDISLQP